MQTPEIKILTSTLVDEGVQFTADAIIPRFNNIGRTISDLLTKEYPHNKFITNSINTIIDKENNRYISKVKYILK